MMSCDERVVMNRKTSLVAAGGVLLGVVIAFPIGLTVGGGDESVKPAVARSPIPTESPSAEADALFAPNLGDRALKIGQTRDGEDVHTTLAEVKYPYPSAESRQPEEGNVFVGLRIEQCVDDDAAGDGDTTYNSEWSAVTEGGEEYGGSGSSWNDWPSPKFPESVSSVPGRCVKGWISLQVPKGTQFTSIIWRPGGDTVAEWIAAG
jgi:hypothetical protein